MSSDSTQEMTNTVATTIGMTRQIFPRKPGMKYSGANATMFVRMLKVIGSATSFAPSMAACVKGIPPWRFSKMFSPATIASSTTMPSAMMKAKSEIMLIVTPKNGRNRNAPRKETGIPSVTQKATRTSRKSPSRTSTRTSPRPPFLRSRVRRWR